MLTITNHLFVIAQQLWGNLLSTRQPQLYYKVVTDYLMSRTNPSNITPFDQGLIQLKQFQKFVLKQIDYLQSSSLSKGSISNLVIQNNCGALKESIINYYFEQRAFKKSKEIHQISDEVTTLKDSFKKIQSDIDQFLSKFRSEMIHLISHIVHKSQAISHENMQLKERLGLAEGKLKQANACNVKLKKDLEEWNEAKERRRSKKQCNKDPSIQNIENILKTKIGRQQTNSKLITPLKQFNFQQFTSKRVSSFDFSSSLVEKKLHDTNHKKYFYGSNIVDPKTNQSITFKSIFFTKTEEKISEPRKSKQKLKVISSQS